MPVAGQDHVDRSGDSRIEDRGWSFGSEMVGPVCPGWTNSYSISDEECVKCRWKVRALLSHNAMGFVEHPLCQDKRVLIKDEGESLRRNRGREQQGRDDYVRVDEDTRRATGPRMLSTSAWTSFASATPKSALASANASCA